MYRRMVEELPPPTKEIAVITYGDGRTAAGEATKVFVWEEGR
jgi:hypothetical protein